MKDSIKLLKAGLGITDTGVKIIFVLLKKNKPMTAPELGSVIGKDRTTILKQITIMFNQDIFKKKVVGTSPRGSITTYELDKQQLSNKLMTYIENQKSLFEKAYCDFSDCKFTLKEILNIGGN